MKAEGRVAEEPRGFSSPAFSPVSLVADLVAAGAQRISVGGALTRVAVDAFVSAVQAIRNRGDRSVLGARPPLQEWFG